MVSIKALLFPQATTKVECRSVKRIKYPDAVMYIYIKVFDLTTSGKLIIIHLTREPEGECRSPDPANNYKK